MLLLHFYVFFCSFLLQVCHGRSTIVLGQSVADGDSLTSSGGTFELGFFTPGSSPHRYVGIWFKKIPVRKVVWVANRLNPVVGSSGVLQIGEDGNLVIMDGQNLTWSTVVSSVSNGSIVELLDSGNLVLREGDSNGSFIWQSFDYPSDCFLQNMKVGLNLKTGEKRFLTSWRSDNDPSPGNFTLGVDQQKLPQGLVWKGSTGGLGNGMELASLEFSAGVRHGFILMVSCLSQIMKKACYTSLTLDTMIPFRPS